MSLKTLQDSVAFVADAAKKVTQTVTEKSKHQMDRFAAERHLAKAQRQLGAVMYSLYKNKEKNPALIQKYLQAVERAEKQFQEITACQAQDSRNVKIKTSCVRCGAEVQKDATFCSCCGQKFE